MPRERNYKEFFWTYHGLKNDFMRALKILHKDKKDIFEPAMKRAINRANHSDFKQSKDVDCLEMEGYHGGQLIKE